MKKGLKKLLIICTTLLILLTVNIVFDALNKSTYILFLLFIFFCLIILFGFEKDKYLYKNDIISTIIISCLFYYTLTYGIGLFVGFVKNGYRLTLIAVIKNITPFFIIIFLEELIRYNLVKKGSRNLLIMILATVILILMDMTLIIRGFNLNDGYLLVEFLLSHLLPSIFKNVFLTFIIYKGGYKTSIIFRLLMDLPLYFIPIFPNLDIYIKSILKILFPTLLWFIVYKMTKHEEPQNIGNRYKKTWNFVFIILILGMIGINCGLFKYYSLTIGSGSMTPNINKGDVIIVEKLKRTELSKLKIGNILVFDKGDKILVHRIVDIKKINNEYYFLTKGDNNNDIDRWILEEKDIIGITKFRIMFIGYPTVWLSEFINSY